jgi:hypothetical protein
MNEWTKLQNMLSGVCLTTQEDEIIWRLSTSKTFTTSSLYKFLTTSGIDCTLVKKIWKCKVPLKIRIFLW